MTKNHKDMRAFFLLQKSLAEDFLDPVMPKETVLECLEAANVDTKALCTEGKALVSELLEKRRLHWQEEARQRIKVRAQITERSRHQETLGRNEMLERLNQFRTDPSLGAPVVAAFHKRNPEEATEQELREMLIEVEMLKGFIEIEEKEPSEL